jgi:hypothetical protein
MIDPTHLLWIRIGAGVCTLMSLGSLFSVVRLRRRADAARSWLRLQGEIIEAGVDRPNTVASDDAANASPRVRYRYSTAGQAFESSQIGFAGVAMMTSMEAQRLIAHYPVGARVDVFADPAQPATAVLDPTVRDSVTAAVVFTLVFGAIAAVLLQIALTGTVATTSRGVPLFAFLLPAASFGVALLGAWLFVADRKKAAATRTWPVAPGRITCARVIEEQVEERDEEDRSGHPRIRTRYQTDLRYAYRVGGRDLAGTAISIGWTEIHGTREGAEAVIARYPEGSSVDVHYDPADPASAVLEAGTVSASWAPLLLALVFGAAGAGMLAFFLKVGFAT